MGIEVQVKITVGLGKDIEAIPEITSGIGPTTEVKVGIEIGLAERGRTKVQNRIQNRLRYFRCSEYDHFARECTNALTDEESESGSENLDDATLQMLSQDGTFSPPRF